MGKNKLAKWAELKTFNNVIQPGNSAQFEKDHPLKGNWNEKIFCNNNSITVELGCGKGEYTVGLALRYPDRNFIGVDIKGARMWRGAKTANENKIQNAAFLRTRIEFIDLFFSHDEVHEIWLTFPDPHSNKHNSNRRLSCPWFLNKYSNFLRNNGVVNLKTDNTELYNYTKSIAERNCLEIIASTTDLHSEFEGNDILSIRTHYEEIFINKGSKICYLAFRLPKNKTIE
ncbi:MAG TPA: tRNA (guanosine(46)-N7)-methyltransferase TrmB [Bacteroidales bacterium]|nr:tRNA (guanosine(46)-N7)-methyltransferase TrmB [Bacteroidales bacterium]HQB36545.1 tRNA (guanosine(46)-N7)-methyltransferase TrmB [Bacteroidales bacterium]